MVIDNDQKAQEKNMRSSRQKVQMWIFALPLLVALTSMACGLSDRISGTGGNEGRPPTRTPLPTFTPTPEGASFVSEIIDASQAEANQPSEQEAGTAQEEPAAQASEPEPTEPPPSPTPEPTEASTSASQAVSITIVQDMNVRTGPGTNYAIAGPGPAGESSKVIGRNADASWLQVEYPLTNDGTGWVYAELVQVSGDPTTVPVVQIAAPAQPVAAAPAPQQKEAPAPAPEAPKYQFTPTGWYASENAAIVQFKGRIRDEGGGLVNGFSVLVNNGSWSVLAHPTGASHHYPDKGDGEWDVVIPSLANGVGWWTLAVASYDCPNFEAAFDAQCKQYTLLSEEIPVEVVYPDETIINADWVCHWDCDKGLYVNAYRR